MRKVLLVAALVSLAPACQRGQSPTVAEASASPSPEACVESTGEAITFELTNYEFTPRCAVGTSSMGLSIKNNGSELHNFSVESTTVIDVDIEPGLQTNTESTGLAAGNYLIFCKYHRDSHNMVGGLHIK